MKKRIFSTILALIMALSVIYALPMSASAATSYTAAHADFSGIPREKVGDYYLWVANTRNNDGDTTSSSLKCKKTLGATAKVLKKTTTKNYEIGQNVVTNGSTIYYVVNNETDWRNVKATIYRTTVKGGTSKVIKKVNGNVSLEAYYNGRIYYNHGDFTLKSYDLSKKTVRTEKKNFAVMSSYGKYITGYSVSSSASALDAGAVNTRLYNVQTRKTTSLPASADAVVSGSKIYYWVFNFKNSGMTVKSCNLSGGNVKTLKTVANVYPHYLGRTAAYFGNSQGKVAKKLTYSTGKLTTLK